MGGWLLVTGLVFSYMQGIIPPYYMVALAPAIGALVGVGAIALLRSDTPVAGRAVAAAGILGTGVWAYVLLNRTPTWLPWLRWTVLIAGLLGAAAVFAVPALTSACGRAGPRRAPRVLAYVPLALALVAGLGGPLAYSLDTANTTHTGSIPSAGPTVAGGSAARVAGAAVPVPAHAPGQAAPRRRRHRHGNGTGTGTGTAPPAGAPGGARGPRRSTGRRPGDSLAVRVPAQAAPERAPVPAAGGAPTAGTGRTAVGGRRAMGGLSGSTQVSSALIKLLEQDASQYKWIAATVGSQSAAPIELATGGDAVLAIGGFNGTDPSPTLAQFEAMVAKREIHYFVGESSNSFGGGNGSSAITSWVAAHFKSQTVGGVTVYNLTAQK